MIYADNSSTTIDKPQEVIDAVTEALTKPWGNPSRGGHHYALEALKAMDQSRQAVAGYFGLEDYWNLGFSPSSTYALNLAIKGALSPGDHVLYSPWEHNSALRPLYQMEQRGVRIELIPSHNGLWTMDDLKAKIQPKTKALVINAMSNVTGDVVPLEDIKALAKEQDLLLILDISQYAGTFKLHIGTDWPKSLIAFTGHKSLYGPRGSGGLISIGDVPCQPVNTGGSGVHSFDREHPHVFPDICEPGTGNLPAIYGLAAAIRWLQARDYEEDLKHLQSLRSLFVEGLNEIPGTQVYGGQTATAGPVIAINIKNIPSSTISQQLDDEFGIATRSGAHCAPLLHEAYGTVEQGMVRFSFGLKNTKEEIVQCLEALEHIASGY